MGSPTPDPGTQIAGSSSSSSTTTRRPLGRAQPRGPRGSLPLVHTDAGGPAVDVIDEDDTCPICQLLLHSPVTTTCGHTLCYSRMATWASVSTEAPMVILDVDDEPEPFNPVSELEARCPMCRTSTVAVADIQRAETLKADYPLACAERASEDQPPSADGHGEEAIQTMTVCIGNKQQIVTPKGDRDVT
ncbi:Uu.00g091810.m01.CDS01 [Anthostomella pinea]|uniref:Uu.00g091810.m01.CDS01 n=1 Tax=Anthostomella pinea TaxID=933095 RepID=A0AAI8YKE2_9PEZI|nr:Uu.00g091810.m01.CDS01 [Anthostomella pinea]